MHVQKYFFVINFHKKTMACLSMVNADGELFGGESSKYEAVGGTNTSTCQHGEHGLRNHGHIDHHQVTRLHTVPHQDTR